MWLRCRRPGTVGANPEQFAAFGRTIQTKPAGASAQETAAQTAEEARRAAEAAERAAQKAAAAAQAAQRAAAEQSGAAEQETQQMSGEQPQTEGTESKSTWGDTMATVVGAAAPTILAGVVLYYLTRTPQ